MVVTEPKLVHAQGPNPGADALPLGTGDTADITPGPGTTRNPDPSVSDIGQGDSGGDTPDIAPADSTPGPGTTRNPNPSASDTGQGGSNEGTPAGGFYQFLYELIIGGFGALVKAGAALLDNSLYYFVQKFGELYNQNFGAPIETAWSIIRDLINFALIFGLVYVGFRFILNADDSGAKRNLVTLILAALLVNFSLFFAKAVVDIANSAAVAFAQSLDEGATQVIDVSDGFATVLGLGTVLDQEGQLTSAAAGGSSAGAYISYLFVLMAILLVAAFVFAAAAALIAIRFIVLSFMLVFSPIVVLGMIFPFFRGLSTKWLNTFLGQAFMAPAMFLMIYVSFLILQGLKQGGNVATDALAQGGSNDPSTLGALTFYILGMGFLIGSLIVAQKMGAAGASTVVSLGKGAVRSGKSFAGRQTLGRVANSGLKAQKSNNRAVRTYGNALRYGVGGNRNLESITQNKFGGAYSYKDDKENREKQEKRDNQIKTDNQNEDAVQAGLKAAQTAESRRSATQRKQIEKMNSVVAKMTQQQLKDTDTQQLQQIAPRLNADQADKFINDSEIDPEKRAAVQKARQEAIRNVVEQNNQIVTDELTKLTVSQLEELEGDFLIDNAHKLSATQVEGLNQSKKLSDTQKRSLKTTRTDKQKQWMNTGQAGAAGLFNTYDAQGARKGRYKPKDVAKLGRDVLLHDNALPNLTANDLEAIAEEKSLPTNDRQELQRKIENEAKRGDAHALKLKDYFKTPHAQEKW
jgi:hypothetical protein